MADESIITKIEALLRKADGASTPEEAEAFYEGATRLMLKYQVDEAMLDPTRDHARETPAWEEFEYSPNNYWMPGKRELLLAACEMAGSGTRFVYFTNCGNGAQACRVVGFAMERSVAKRAYASLYMQARMGASAAGCASKREVSSFMVGYARGVIYKVISAQTDEEAKLSSSTALALRDRSDEVKDLYEAEDVRPAPEYEAEQRALRSGWVEGQNADLMTQERIARDSSSDRSRALEA